MTRAEQPRTYSRTIKALEAKVARLERLLSRVGGTGAAGGRSGLVSAPVPVRPVGDDGRVWEASWVDGAAVQAWVDGPGGTATVTDLDGTSLGTLDGEEQQPVQLAAGSRVATAVLAAPAARDGLVTARVVATHPVGPPVVVVSDTGR